MPKRHNFTPERKELARQAMQKYRARLKAASRTGEDGRTYGQSYKELAERQYGVKPKPERFYE